MDNTSDRIYTEAFAFVMLNLTFLYQEKLTQDQIQGKWN